MSITSLWNYVDYLKSNQLVSGEKENFGWAWSSQRGSIHVYKYLSKFVQIVNSDFNSVHSRVCSLSTAIALPAKWWCFWGRAFQGSAGVTFSRSRLWDGVLPADWGWLLYSLKTLTWTRMLMRKRWRIRVDKRRKDRKIQPTCKHMVAECHMLRSTRLWSSSISRGQLESSCLTFLCTVFPVSVSLLPTWKWKIGTTTGAKLSHVLFWGSARGVLSSAFVALCRTLLAAVWVPLSRYVVQRFFCTLWRTCRMLIQPPCRKMRQASFRRI